MLRYIKLIISYIAAFTLLLTLLCINMSLNVLLSLVNCIKKRTLEIFLWKKKWSKLRHIKTQLKSVQNFEDWYKLANKYDKLTGLKKWRLNDKSSKYDYKYISQIEKLLTRYIANENIQELVTLIQSTTRRDVGGIMHPSLYQQAISGTKDLISSY